MRDKQGSHQHLMALDGLRAVSILIVAFSHIFLLVGIGHIPGTFGVTIFFFISGFIITRLLLQESADSGTIRLAPFYVRRFFRLAPALMVYIAFSCIILAALGRRIPGLDVAAVLFYFANYYDIYHHFAQPGNNILSPFVITWSLAVEEHFYFLFPLLLLGLRKRSGALLLTLAGFIVTIAAWRMYLVYHAGSELLPLMRIEKATDTRLDSIAFGCLLSVLFYRAQSQGDLRVKGLLDALRGYAGVGVCMALLAVSFGIRNAWFRETLMYSLQGLAMIALFCALFWTREAPRWVAAPLENRAMVFLGAISYSLYLYHYLALVIAQLTIKSPVLQVTAAWVLAFCGSVFSYYVVEQPMRRFGSAWSSRLKKTALAGAAHAFES